MPEVFRFYGFSFFFYSREHEPPHVHVGLFGDFINNCYTKIYEIHSKLKGTKKCNHEKGQIYEFCRAKPAFKSEQDLTIR